MKTSSITRAVAAIAAAGIALVLPATAASAQTVPPVVPVIPPVSLGIGTAPVIRIGATPTASAPSTATAAAGSTPSATVAPAPGIRATVPATAAGNARVGNPLPGLLAPAAPTLGLLPGVAGVPGLATLGQPVLADADVQPDACVAGALLTGQPTAGCSSSVSGQPSLAEALSTVGVCARAELLAGSPVTPCGATAPADGSPGTTPAPTPTLADVAAAPDLCVVASVLGGSATPCPDTASTGTGSTPPGAGDSPSTVATTLDACIGAAVLTSTDLTPCTTSTALSDTPVTAAVSGTQSTGVSGIDGGTGGNGGNGATPQDTALALSDTTSGNGGLATPLGTLPVTGFDAGSMALVALALVGSGVAMRRLRKEYVDEPRVGNDTRFPRRPHRVR